MLSLLLALTIISSGPSVMHDGWTITLESVRQRETVTHPAGAATEPARVITLALLVRPPAGQERFDSLSGLRARDSTGRELTAVPRQPRPLRPAGDWEFEVSFTGYGEGARSLTWFQGEIRVTQPSGDERRIPFRFTRVPLPLAAGDMVSGLTLRVPSRATGELMVGISAKRGAGWGPIRWERLETDASGAAALELPPGRYRIQARFRPRNIRGELGATSGLKPTTAAVVAGRVAPVNLAR